MDFEIGRLERLREGKRREVKISFSFSFCFSFLIRQELVREVRKGKKREFVLPPLQGGGGRRKIVTN